MDFVTVVFILVPRPLPLAVAKLARHPIDEPRRQDGGGDAEQPDLNPALHGLGWSRRVVFVRRGFVGSTAGWWKTRRPAAWESQAPGVGASDFGGDGSNVESRPHKRTAIAHELDGGRLRQPD